MSVHTFDVSEYEVIEANLPPEQHFHVDLVGIERAEEDLLGVEVVAPGDLGVKLLHVREARNDARRAAVRLLAMECQFWALRWVFGLLLLRLRLLLLRLLPLLFLLLLL